MERQQQLEKAEIDRLEKRMRDGLEISPEDAVERSTPSVSKSIFVKMIKGNPLEKKVKIYEPDGSGGAITKEVPAYTLVEDLGKGSFGKVSHVKDHTGHSFALKT